MSTQQVLTPGTRDYDIIVFGATGYTGKLTAEAVLKYAPTDLKWAIAGRSQQKLERLRDQWNSEFPDRKGMGIVICDLSPDQIDAMTKATTLLITTVGPFLRYGTPVMESCAKNGTHYVDSTGEYPWVKEMVERFHMQAKEKGIIMVPQCGFDSVPADICAWKMVKTLRDGLGVGAGKTTFAMHKLEGGMVSGGTFESAINLLDTLPLSQIVDASRFDALSPISGPPQPKISPVRRDPDLGIICTSLSNDIDRSQVFRSWGLINGGNYYGKSFSWTEVMQRKGWLHAWATWGAVAVAKVLLAISPIRWIARKLAPHQVGEGPSEEDLRKTTIEFHGIAEADTPPVASTQTSTQNTTSTASTIAPQKKAFLKFKGPDPYIITGIVMVEVALAILFDEDTEAKRLGGGVLTSACLASDRLLERLKGAGVNVECEIV